MNVKNLIGTVLDTAIKIFLIVVIVSYTYKYAMQAYEFGYRIFAEAPMSSEETARVISISVAEDATVMEIGTVLEEKGMIRDAKLFFIQELLSKYHDEIKPGIYELSSDMTAKEMLAVMSAETEEGEEGEEDAAKEEEVQQEPEEEGSSENDSEGGEAEPGDETAEAE